MPNSLPDAESNPYRSPDRSAGPEHADEFRSRSTFEEIGRVMVTWEKLRLIYNGIGLFPTLILVFGAATSPVEIAGCAFVANVCYCLGPVLEGYLVWFGVRSRVATAILFLLGTMVMLVLAIWYVALRTFRWMD